MLPYNPDIDRIKSLDQAMKNYQQEFDMIGAAEAHYERMRTLNNTTLLQINVTNSIGNVLSGLRPESVFEDPRGALINGAIRELRASILARGVGPIEEIPVGDYIQDSVRAKNVLTHTQVGPEQKLWAKLMRERSWKRGGDLPEIRSKYTEEVPAQGSHDAKSYMKSSPITFSGPFGPVYVGDAMEKDVPTPEVATNQEQSTARAFKNNEVSRQIVALTKNKDGSDKIIKSEWSVNKEYNASEAGPVVGSTFTFALKNLANNRTVSFPAHITSMNEGLTSSWNSLSLINRSEDIYVYQRAERSFDMQFWLFAQAEEIVPTENLNTEGNPFPNVITIDGTDIGIMDKKMMWDRMNFLHTCTRPEYSAEGKFNKAPYCLLYLGDLFHGITIAIESINVSYDPLLWDINVTDFKGVTPMVAQITLSGKLLHKRAPDAYYRFYGVS